MYLCVCIFFMKKKIEEREEAGTGIGFDDFCLSFVLVRCNSYPFWLWDSTLSVRPICPIPLGRWVEMSRTNFASKQRRFEKKVFSSSQSLICKINGRSRGGQTDRTGDLDSPFCTYQRDPRVCWLVPVNISYSLLFGLLCVSITQTPSGWEMLYCCWWKKKRNFFTTESWIIVYEVNYDRLFFEKISLIFRPCKTLLKDSD